MEQQTTYSIPIAAIKTKCDNCHFSKANRMLSRLECHRHSPVVLVDGQTGLFPIVDYENWCGEWEWDRVIKEKGE